MSRWIFALAALAVPAFVACTVGGAGPAYFIGSDDPSPGTREAPSNTADRPPGAGGSSSGGSSSGGSSGKTGGCPGSCAGRYTCTDSQGKKSTFSFKEKNGACDGSGLTLSCDGKLSTGGQAVGTWSQSGTSLTLNGGGTSLNCVSDADDDPPPPVPVPTPQPPQPPTVDASAPNPPGQG